MQVFFAPCHREEQPTPIVLLSAYDRPQLLERAATAGAGAYLIKPPYERCLQRVITVCLARFAGLQALSNQNREQSVRVREETPGESHGAMDKDGETTVVHDCTGVKTLLRLNLLTYIDF